MKNTKKKKMCCDEQLVSKYFALNSLNLMKQQLKKEMVRKQKAVESKPSTLRKGRNRK